MLRGLGIILWVKDRIVKSHRLAREEVEDIRVCEITPELYYIWNESLTHYTWSATDNNQGYTPLELLQDPLEIKRTYLKDSFSNVDVSDYFQGFSLDTVEYLVALRGLSDIKRIQRLRLKYGCTCRECIGVSISPRMKAILGFSARAFQATLIDSVDDGTLWL